MGEGVGLELEAQPRHVGGDLGQDGEGEHPRAVEDAVPAQAGLGQDLRQARLNLRFSQEGMALLGGGPPRVPSLDSGLGGVAADPLRPPQVGVHEALLAVGQVAHGRGCITIAPAVDAVDR